MSVPYIQVEGPAYERGRQYGEQAEARIHKSVEIYTPAFAANGLDDARVRELAGRFLTVIRDFDAEAADELRGVADGAGLEVEQIVAINARTELLYWQDDGCTGVACLPAATADDHVLLAQNWDWRPACAESTVVLHIRPDSGPELITYVEGGLLGRAGLNSAGIAVTGNFLRSDQDFGRSGVPIPFIRRRILQSQSLAEAVGWVVRTPRAFSSNHLIADAGGEAIDCESAPEDVFFLQAAADGILAHSNHFLAPAALTRLRDTGIERYPDTLYRDRRVRHPLQAASPNVTVEDVQDALRDHFGRPDSVCRHPAPRPDGTMITTVASLVMDVSAGRMWVADGPPCENEYVEYTLEREVAHAV